MISKHEPLRRLQFWQSEPSVGNELLGGLNSAESFYFMVVIKSHRQLYFQNKPVRIRSLQPLTWFSRFHTRPETSNAFFSHKPQLPAFLIKTIKVKAQSLTLIGSPQQTKALPILNGFILMMISSIYEPRCCVRAVPPSLCVSLACLKLKPDTCGAARRNWEEFKQLADLSFCALQTSPAPRCPTRTTVLWVQQTCCSVCSFCTFRSPSQVTNQSLRNHLFIPSSDLCLF